MKPVPLFAALVFLLVAVAHLLRVVLDIPVTIGKTPLPMWPSIVGVIVPGVLALGLWRERRR